MFVVVVRPFVVTKTIHKYLFSLYIFILKKTVLMFGVPPYIYKTLNIILNGDMSYRSSSSSLFPCLDS